MIALLIAAGEVVRAQAKADEPPSVSHGTLEEIRDKRKAHLMIITSDVVDVRSPEAGVAQAVQNYKPETGRQRRVYLDIAKRLNKYIRKYGSMVGVNEPSDAEFLVVFNLLRYRRILYSLYASGEMYVLINRPNQPVRILWKTGKEMLSEDATSKLIEVLKQFRREK